jgi:hypothetical protein
MIDTQRDYDVHVAFDWNPEGFLNGFTTTLSQAANNVTIARKTSPNAAGVPSPGGFPLDGNVAMLVQVSSMIELREMSNCIVLLCELLSLC